MRKIKFRGIDINSKKWVYGHYDITEEFTDNGGIGCYYREGIQELHHIIKEGLDWKIYTVYPTTVGQFIGLKDKNGVEIYDGDCMLVEEYVIGFVFFDIEKSCYSFRLRDGISPHDYNHESFDVEEISNYNIDKMEVIGNIYEEDKNEII